MDEQQTDTENPSAKETSRLHLLWDVLIFQFKLAADGLRDILLSPISIASAVMGLISGGDEPDRYFKQVLQLGRRSEIWINLFGYRKHSGTADELIAPIKDRVFNEAENHPWVSKAGKDLNSALDSVNDSISSGLKQADRPPKIRPRVDRKTSSEDSVE